MNKMLFLQNNTVINIVVWDGESTFEVNPDIVQVPFGDDFITIGSILNNDGSWTHPSEPE